MKVLRARPETFGAIVSTEAPASLLYVDRAMAEQIGVDGGALWAEEDRGLSVEVLSAPTEAHVAVTDRCPAGCSGCYADATPDGHEPAFEDLCARLDELAELGVFRVAFGGGEPAMRAEIGRLAEHARARGLVPTMTTSGLGVTEDNAASFRAFAQVNVSVDGDEAGYREVRGWDGAGVAERAIALLTEAGVDVGVNVVLTRGNLLHVPRLAAHVEQLGAVELQLLRWKPTGRGQLDYLQRRLTRGQIAEVPMLLRRLSVERELAIRIDCAMVPFLVDDPRITAGDLSRFGVSGCEAGRSLMTVDSRGGVHPCSFHHAEAATEVTEPAAWARDSSLQGFRAHAAAPPEPCASCNVREVCRGGCRIVAAHLHDPRAADPECPRVRRFVAANSG